MQSVNLQFIQLLSHFLRKFVLVIGSFAMVALDKFGRTYLKDRYPKKMEIVRGPSGGQCTALPAIGTGSVGQSLRYGLARPGTKEKEKHSFGF